ncbi:hypothetical protein CYMTET_24138 [Cymbomonas tetramitiformis]|uniref:Uncharacterized protein n=1 Tax=Cymbomonas tetramitiformis TaxID=36881 RepID=A0AAE0L0I5_9CHLO|nr:hypothetical protein CYMTET_24138 [Cymbomonas tetramitiformis]
MGAGGVAVGPFRDTLPEIPRSPQASPRRFHSSKLEETPKIAPTSYAENRLAQLDAYSHSVPNSRPDASSQPTSRGSPRKLFPASPSVSHKRPITAHEGPESSVMGSPRRRSVQRHHEGSPEPSAPMDKGCQATLTPRPPTRPGAFEYEPGSYTDCLVKSSVRAMVHQRPHTGHPATRLEDGSRGPVVPAGHNVSRFHFPPMDHLGDMAPCPKLPYLNFHFYDVEVPWNTDDPALDTSALSKEQHDYYRLYYSRREELDASQLAGKYGAPERWHSFCASKLDDMEQLADWISELRPRAIQDFKPMFILAQAVVKDMLVGAKVGAKLSMHHGARDASLAEVRAENALLKETISDLRSMNDHASAHMQAAPPVQPTTEVPAEVKVAVQKRMTRVKTKKDLSSFLQEFGSPGHELAVTMHQFHEDEEVFNGERAKWNKEKEAMAQQVASLQKQLEDNQISLDHFVAESEELRVKETNLQGVLNASQVRQKKLMSDFDEYKKGSAKNVKEVEARCDSFEVEVSELRRRVKKLLEELEVHEMDNANKELSNADLIAKVRDLEKVKKDQRLQLASLEERVEEGKQNEQFLRLRLQDKGEVDLMIKEEVQSSAQQATYIANLKVQCAAVSKRHTEAKEKISELEKEIGALGAAKAADAKAHEDAIEQANFTHQQQQDEIKHLKRRGLVLNTEKVKLNCSVMNAQRQLLQTNHQMEEMKAELERLGSAFEPTIIPENTEPAPLPEPAVVTVMHDAESWTGPFFPKAVKQERCPGCNLALCAMLDKDTMTLKLGSMESFEPKSEDAVPDEEQEAIDEGPDSVTPSEEELVEGEAEVEFPSEPEAEPEAEPLASQTDAADEAEEEAVADSEQAGESDEADKVDAAPMAVSETERRLKKEIEELNAKMVTQAMLLEARLRISETNEKRAQRMLLKIRTGATDLSGDLADDMRSLILKMAADKRKTLYDVSDQLKAINFQDNETDNEMDNEADNSMNDQKDKTLLEIEEKLGREEIPAATHGANEEADSDALASLEAKIRNEVEEEVAALTEKREAESAQQEAEELATMEVQQAIELVAESKKQTESRLEEAQAHLVEAREAKEHTEQALAEAQLDLQGLVEARDQVEAAVAEVKDSLKDVNDSTEQVKATLAAVQSELQDISVAKEEVEQQLAKTKDELQQARDTKEQAEVALTEAELEKQAMAEAKEDAALELARMRVDEEEMASEQAEPRQNLHSGQAEHVYTAGTAGAARESWAANVAGAARGPAANILAKMMFSDTELWKLARSQEDFVELTKCVLKCLEHDFDLDTRLSCYVDEDDLLDLSTPGSIFSSAAKSLLNKNNSMEMTQQQIARPLVMSAGWGSKSRLFTCNVSEMQFKAALNGTREVSEDMIIIPIMSEQACWGSIEIHGNPKDIQALLAQGQAQVDPLQTIQSGLTKALSQVEEIELQTKTTGANAAQTWHQGGDNKEPQDTPGEQQDSTGGVADEEGGDTVKYNSVEDCRSLEVKADWDEDQGEIDALNQARKTIEARLASQKMKLAMGELKRYRLPGHLVASCAVALHLLLGDKNLWRMLVKLDETSNVRVVPTNSTMVTIWKYASRKLSNVSIILRKLVEFDPIEYSQRKFCDDQGNDITEARLATLHHIISRIEAREAKKASTCAGLIFDWLNTVFKLKARHEKRQSKIIGEMKNYRSRAVASAIARRPSQFKPSSAR